MIERLLGANLTDIHLNYIVETLMASFFSTSLPLDGFDLNFEVTVHFTLSSAVD